MALMPIEWGKVREFALATGNGRPEYLTQHAVIPPTFLATVILWTDDLGASDHPDVLAACEAAGIERGWGSMLSLEQEYEFHGTPPRVGDRLLISNRFDSTETKKGSRGAMVFVRFTVLFHDDVNGVPGALRAECHYTSAFVANDGQA